MAERKDSETLQKLLHDTLRDTLDAERQITKGLPKMAKNASSPVLKQGFETHLKQTEEHITRLERAFEIIGKTARGKHCDRPSITAYSMFYLNNPALNSFAPSRFLETGQKKFRGADSCLTSNRVIGALYRPNVSGL